MSVAPNNTDKKAVITVYYDNGSTRTLNVGIDDGMSEADWDRWHEITIATRKSQLSQRVPVLPINKYSGGTNGITETYDNSTTGNHTVKTNKIKCGYCTETGECPYCNSAGQANACANNRFGITCDDPSCVAKNHRCTFCNGTHVCQSNGTSYAKLIHRFFPFN
jgi:hypothetical protein